MASSTLRKSGVVVPGNNKLERWRIFEKVLPHEPADTVSPPVKVLIRLSAHRRPSSVSVAVTRRAAQHGEVSGVAVDVCRGECLDWRCPMVIAHDSGRG